MKLGKQINLKDFSNFRIGGPALDFVETENLDEVIDTVKTAKQVGLPVFVLGGGTNILWSDEGFKGVVIKPAFNFIQVDGFHVTAGSGVSMDKLVSSAVSRGLAGLEWTGGLPGTFGGAVAVNAGCFGGEVKDSINEVVSLDMDTLEIKRRSAQECNFEYRNSIFKHGGVKEIIIQATVKLTKGDKLAMDRILAERVRYREDRQPLTYPNIGSIFKNIRVEGLPKTVVDEHRHVIKTDPFPVIPAAHLIAKSQLKGMSVGGAIVSPKHPNFIVNVQDAKSSDVLELISMVKGKVSEKFGINLEEEVLIVD